MSGKFITPTVAWKNFKVGEIASETLSEEIKGGVICTNIRISGQTYGKNPVSIFGVLCRKKQMSLCPAVLIVQDFKDGADPALAMQFAEKGYTALVVDIAGKTEFSEKAERPFTVYPEEVSFADYNEKAESSDAVENGVENTCWFVWSRVIRYAAEYLKRQPFITGVGALGIFGAATPLWHVLASDCGLISSVIVGNAGWKGYRGINKFAEKDEPQFSDEQLQYLAGVEPQAYAPHVKCPVLVISPTNSPVYDADRAGDTVSRVSEKIYSALDYSVGGRNEISYECYQSTLAFFSETLIKGNLTDLPTFVGVKGKLTDGALKIEVTPTVKGLKELSVYCAEEFTEPQKRSWNKVTDVEAEKNGTFTFIYHPFKQSGAVTYFARAKYDNGFCVSSFTSCVKFAAEDVRSGNKHRVVLSSRMAEPESGFYPEKENVALPFGISTDKADRVTLKNATELGGLFCERGLLTFKVACVKYKPSDGAMLMMDAFGITEGTLTVSLIADYFGEKVVYRATTLVLSAWNNVRFEMNNFKTEDGRSLKDYGKIEAITFSADCSFLINNVLWV